MREYGFNARHALGYDHWIGLGFANTALAAILYYFHNSGIRADGITLEDESTTGTDRPVQTGRCYDFNGANDHVTFGDVLDFERTSAFSLVARFKTSTVGYQTIVSKNESLPNYNGYQLRVNNDGNLLFALGRSGGNIAVATTGLDVDDGSEYVVIATYDGSSSASGVTIYVNKVSASLSTSSDSLTTTTLTAAPLSIGSRYNTENYFDGKIWDVQIYSKELSQAEVNYISTNGTEGTDPRLTNCKLWAKCDEQDGTTCYDSSGNGNHGTITNATLSTFHAADTSAFSYQNEYGYSDGTGNIKVPRNEASPTLDVLSATLDYTGRVPYDASLVKSHCATFDGVDDYISAPHLAGTETVTSSGGTSTPTISAGRIDFTAGTCWDLQLSDGTHYPHSEGDGTTAYNIASTSNHGTITNATLATFWGSTQDNYHCNLENGFRLSTTVKIPALTSGASAADGNSITNPSGNWHNDAETLIKPNPNDAPALVAKGLTSATEWDFGGVITPATSTTDTNKEYDYKVTE